jgi:ABC-2 type transport system permease protein
MNNFMVQAYATYKGLFYWLTWISYITNVFLGPAIAVITYALLGQFAFDIEAARYYGLGIIMSQMAFVVVSGITQAYTYDRALGTISYFYISPAGRLANYLSRAAFHFPNGILVYATGLLTLRLLLNIDFSTTNWTAFTLAVLITAASISAFASLLGIFSIVIRDWVHAMVIATGILTVFTGIIIPVDIFPPVIRGFAAILPITNGLDAVRSAIAGSTAAEIYFNILQEAIVCIVYLATGFMGFIFFEKLAKRNGTLERDAT